MHVDATTPSPRAPGRTDTQVATPYGVVEGIRQGGVRLFAGLPYARPPLGDLRFRSPRPPEAWTGVRPAGTFPPNPIQRRRFGSFAGCSEDCLYLNVWVPDVDAGGLRPEPSPSADPLLPVLFWIHGGSFATGGAGTVGRTGRPGYDGATLARDTGCVVVTTNYRLNVLGFVDFSDIDARFESNLGLRDLVAALEWVGQSIAAFGGDPGNVTVAGESAGAAAATALLFVPAAAPLFARVISQSNCLESFHTPAEATHQARTFLRLAGLGQDDAAGVQDLSHADLMAAAARLEDHVLGQAMGRCVFCPVVDGQLLTDFPTRGSFTAAGKPMIVGTNLHEANLYQVLHPSITTPQVIGERLLGGFPAERREEILTAYDPANLGQVFTDVMFRLPACRLADRASESVPVHMYRMDYFPPILGATGVKAFHAAELPLLFGDLGMMRVPMFTGNAPVARTLGWRLRRYWGAFARTGTPTPAGLPPWPAYDTDRRATMVFDRTDTVVADPQRDLRELYEGVDRLLI